MKKFLYVLLSVSSCILINADQANNKYAQELNALEEHPDYKHIFDKNRHAILRYIDAELKNYPQLTAGSKFLYRDLLMCGTIVANKENMPELYTFIEQLCAKASIDMPIILVMIFPGFNNAAASKLLISSGVVIIGRDLLFDVDQDEIEAILAHELGHIKYNHINKKIMLTGVLSMLGTGLFYHHIQGKTPLFNDMFTTIFITALSSALIGSLSKFIINKRFEREADEFAYKEMNKAHGLIKYFSRLEKAHNDVNQDFEETYARLLEQQNKVTFEDFRHLTSIYRNSWIDLQLSNAWSWLYHHTPLGEHPSHEARIKAAQNYLSRQETEENQAA